MDWIDIAKVDWSSEAINPDTTVLFIDDHQSGYRRAFLEMSKFGFSKFLVENNYPYLKGDNYSFKWVCKTRRSSQWPESVNDNFAHTKISMTWEKHMEHARFMSKVLKTYYEFPPVALTELSGQTRFVPEYTSAPIVTDRDFFQKHLSSFEKVELNGYTHFAYVEIDPSMKDTAPSL